MLRHGTNRSQATTSLRASLAMICEHSEFAFLGRAPLQDTPSESVSRPAGHARPTGPPPWGGGSPPSWRGPLLGSCCGAATWRRGARAAVRAMLRRTSRSKTLALMLHALDARMCTHRDCVFTDSQARRLQWHYLCVSILRRAGQQNNTGSRSAAMSRPGGRAHHLSDGSPAGASGRLARQAGDPFLSRLPARPRAPRQPRQEVGARSPSLGAPVRPQEQGVEAVVLVARAPQRLALGDEGEPPGGRRQLIVGPGAVEDGVQGHRPPRPRRAPRGGAEKRGGW